MEREDTETTGAASASRQPWVCKVCTVAAWRGSGVPQGQAFGDALSKAARRGRAGTPPLPRPLVVEVGVVDVVMERRHGGEGGAGDGRGGALRAKRVQGAR